jgi:5-methylcytosine-specific restriction endonuclease McrA
MTYSTEKTNSRKISSDPEVRNRVLSDYNKTCAAIRIYESKELPVKCHSKRKLEIDHAIELRWGGLDVEVNLQPLCHTCHKMKTAENSKFQITKKVIMFK